MLRILVGLGLLISVAADADAAGRYDSRVLHQQGAWQVELVHDTSDGDLWCAAKTRNRTNQTLDITGFDNGTVRMFIFDSRWKLGRRDVQFRLDIDYERWNVKGTAVNSAIAAQLNNADKAAKFLSDLMGGSAAALYNQNGNRLGVFSLNGSRSAISSLMKCWKAVIDRNRPSSSDPFGRAAGGRSPNTPVSTDPF